MTITADTTQHRLLVGRGTNGQSYWETPESYWGRRYAGQMYTCIYCGRGGGTSDPCALVVTTPRPRRTPSGLVTGATTVHAGCVPEGIKSIVG